VLKISTFASVDAEPRPDRAATSGSRARRLFAWTLLACWAVLLPCIFILGERASTFAHLEAQVAAGDVHEVRISGGLSPAERGFSVVEVHWRQGIRAYTTKVIEARPRAAGSEAAHDGVTALINENLGGRLKDIQPGIRVKQESRATGPVTEAYGWDFTGWIVWALIIQFLCTLGLLIYGPEPRRATRWAWFWLISAAAPITALAFLALGGSTSRHPAADKSARLTGGWAFLLASVLATVLSNISY
jgi:hypothetical protein